MMEWIRFGIVALCFVAGLAVLYLSIFGTYRLRFALNRIHSAAMTDTLVLILFAVALIIAEGLSFASVKFAMAMILQWCTSPLSAHMMAKFEYLTDDRLYENCALIDHTAESDGSEEPVATVETDPKENAETEEKKQ